MIIEYSEDGIALSDFKVREFLIEKYNKKEDIVTSNEILIDMARSLIVEGIFDSNEITFKFKGWEIKPDGESFLEFWPDGFCSFRDDCLFTILSGKKET